jgi:hypothetical protein
MRAVVANELASSAFLPEIGAVLKIGSGIYKTVKTVTDDLQGELVTRICILDSYATLKHHEIRLRIENHSRSGTYVESVGIQIRKMKKADASLTKDGVNLSSKLFVQRDGLGDEEEKTIVFPVRISSDDFLEFHIRLNLLNKTKFKDKPYLHAVIVFSRLDTEKEETEMIPFRIRWT